MAFTEEQSRLLGAAFDHVWARMSALHDTLNDDSERIAALGLILAEQGLITAEQWEGAIAQLAVQAGLETRQLQSQRADDLTEEEITRQILDGDDQAFERRREEEDEG
jgi:hypothetical protein